MSCRFVIIECKKCQDIRQIQWPFNNVLRIYSEYCNRCSFCFKLSKQQKSSYEWRVQPEVILSQTDIPSQLRNTTEDRVLALLYTASDNFRWYTQEESKVTFPSFKLKYLKDGSYSHGVVELEQLELFLNEPDYSW